MCTKVIEINFKDLLNYSDDTLLESVPLKQAVEATIESSRNLEVSQWELYKYWAVSLFKQYGAGNMKCSELSPLLELFSSIIDQLLQECQEDKENSGLATCLDYSLELFSWIQSVAGDFGIDELTAFLCFGLSMLSSFLVFISNQPCRGETNNVLLVKSLSIQQAIVRTIIENLEMLTFAENKESCLADLMERLCAVGELSPKLDIKTAVDTWKGIIKLASQNSGLVQTKSAAVDWLKKPFCFLISEIGRNIQTIYKEASLSEPIEQIKKFLKVTNFYLKLLQKLITDFSYAAFPAYPEFLHTLGIVLRPPAYIVETPVHDVVIEYVATGLKEIIPMVYKKQIFFEHLANEEWSDMGLFFEIVLEVIEICMQRGETEYIASHILDVAFRRLSQHFQVFLSAPIYHRFIETVAALYINSEMEHLQNLLIESVLQEDIVLASAAMDIWCIVFGYNHSSRIEYFTFWRDINESFAMFSEQLPAIHVEHLLKTLYTLFSSQEQAAVWDKYDMHASKNDRFLLTIGLASIPSEVMKFTVIQYYVNALYNLLKESRYEITVDNYYTIIRDLKLLTPVGFRCQDTIGLLIPLLEFSIKNSKLHLLFESILDFLTSKLNMMDDSKTLRILTDLSVELDAINSLSTNLSIARFLKQVSKIPQLERHSMEILKILQTDEMIKYYVNDNPKEDTSLAIDKDLYKGILQSRMMDAIKPVHICKMDDNNSPERKKRKTDIDALLESIETNVDILISEAQLEKLDPSKADVVRRVARKLNDIESFS